MPSPKWEDLTVSRVLNPLVDVYHGLLCSNVRIHVKLLTEVIITLEIDPRMAVHDLCDQIRRYHASSSLNWPSSCRASRPSSRAFAVPWDAPAALRLHYYGHDLDDAYTLAQSGIRPGSHLSAHMYFSQRKSLGKINVPECRQRRVKHAMTEDDADQLCYTGKRQKFNEPLRNQHFHRIFDLRAGLETNRENAARYGLDIGEMEDLLKELDDADKDMDDWDGDSPTGFE